jgi:hypothetical protein
MKKLMMTAAILAVTIAPAMADRDLVMKLPKGNLCQDRNGKVFTNRVCKSPEANALVRKSNELVKGHPTCAQLLEASRLLERATDLYIKVGDVSGEVRDISRATSWTEDRAKAGKCRGGKHGGLDGVKVAQRGPVRDASARGVEEGRRNPNAIGAGTPVPPLPNNTEHKRAPEDPLLTGEEIG